VPQVPPFRLQRHRGQALLNDQSLKRNKYTYNQKVIYVNSLKTHSRTQLPRRQGPLTGATLDGLRRLRSLGLSSNRLSGPLPRAVKRLRGLRDLRLSYNKLTGRFPTYALAECAHLQCLFVNGNTFSPDLNHAELASLGLQHHDLPVVTNDDIADMLLAMGLGSGYEAPHAMVSSGGLYYQYRVDQQLGGSFFASFRFASPCPVLASFGDDRTLSTTTNRLATEESRRRTCGQAWTRLEQEAPGTRTPSAKRRRARRRSPCSHATRQLLTSWASTHCSPSAAARRPSSGRRATSIGATSR
jgi:hypothetical protein